MRFCKRSEEFLLTLFFNHFISKPFFQKIYLTPAQTNKFPLFGFLFISFGLIRFFLVAGQSAAMGLMFKLFFQKFQESWKLWLLTFLSIQHHVLCYRMSPSPTVWEPQTTAIKGNLVFPSEELVSQCQAGLMVEPHTGVFVQKRRSNAADDVRAALSAMRTLR